MLHKYYLVLQIVFRTFRNTLQKLRTEDWHGELLYILFPDSIDLTA